MRISDWSSDVCSSDLDPDAFDEAAVAPVLGVDPAGGRVERQAALLARDRQPVLPRHGDRADGAVAAHGQRSEEHTSELQYLMRRPYAVFCSTNNNNQDRQNTRMHSRHTYAYRMPSTS